MTDRQRIQFLLDKFEDATSLELIIHHYLLSYDNEITTDRLLSIRDNLNSTLDFRLKKLVEAVQVAQERSLYLSNYLEGNMYTEDADSDACRQVQLMNAKTLFETVAEVKL